MAVKSQTIFVFEFSELLLILLLFLLLVVVEINDEHINCLILQLFFHNFVGYNFTPISSMKNTITYFTYEK